MARREALLFSLLTALSCRAASPHLEAISPPGVQRGTETEITLSGSRLDDARSILFYTPGIEVESLQPADGGRAKAKLRVAPDCALGEHDLRLVTTSGITELLPLYVGPFPNVIATGTNHDAQHAQPVPMNSTVNGVIRDEQIDYFSVQAVKGQRITAEVEGMRLGREMFDPWLAIMDARGRQLASNDDNPLLLQDPLASIIAPEDGAYLLAVRESTWGGSDRSAYRLHVGAFPQPMAVYPAGGQAGQDLALTFLGDVKGSLTKTVKLPAAVNDFAVAAEDGGLTAPTANPLRVSPFPNVLEQAPNGDIGHATTTDLPLPVAFNGILHQPGAKGFFRFRAKKGMALDITVFARQLRSPLDSILVLYDAHGGHIADNDDSIGQDSYLRFNVPADGDYCISVRDHLRRGGPQFVYRVEVKPAEPRVTFTVPEIVKNSQERQVVVVPRGNYFATMIRVKKEDFDGQPVLNIGDLPPGVTAQCGTPAGELVPVLFQAAPDAAPGAKLCPVKCQGSAGGYDQTVELVRGTPNDTVYYKTGIDRLAVGVAEEAPFRLNLVQPKAPMVQNGSGSLKVAVERKPGFTGPVTVSMLYNPPGMGSDATVTIPADKTEAQLPISASGDAKARVWQVSVIGSADAGKGPVWVSSGSISLEVAKPFVEARIERNEAEQGESATIVCDLDQVTPFEGKAHARLLGLPNKVSAPELDFTAADKALKFNVTTDPASPAGKHKDLFCQITFQKQGETIIENTGFGGVLRIDRPAGKKEVAAK